MKCLFVRCSLAVVSAKYLMNSVNQESSKFNKAYLYPIKDYVLIGDAVSIVLIEKSNSSLKFSS
jgi:hypothetical protein